MKKIKYLIIIAAICLVLTGCGKMSEKKINSIKKELKDYVKNNMPSNWEYNPDKVTIDNEFNASIKMYNMLDLSDCYLNAKSAYTTLKDNLDEESYLNDVSIYCEYGEETVGHVIVKDIKKLKIDDLDSKAILYNSEDETITVDENFYNTQKADFISKCQNYNYKDVFRNSNDYLSKYAVFTGEVVQVVEEGKYYAFRIDVTKTEWDYYEDTMYATIPKSYFEGRIINGDILTIYGRLTDLTTYESILGEQITIPTIDVRYAELNN